MLYSFDNLSTDSPRYYFVGLSSDWNDAFWIEDCINAWVFKVLRTEPQGSAGEI